MSYEHLDLKRVQTTAEIPTKAKHPEGTPVSLESDFIDYYDHWFDLSSTPGAIPFTRYSVNEMTRGQAFSILFSHHIQTVVTGLVKYMDRDTDLVVVYRDLQAHRGEGKELMPWSDAMAVCPDALCSKFEGILKDAVSIRHLQVGQQWWRMVYRSDDLWRSNCGNVKIEMTSMSGAGWWLPYPLYAVDFVPHRRPADPYGRYGEMVSDFEQLLAVDLNLSPQIGGTPVEAVRTPKEMAELVKIGVRRWGVHPY